MSKRLNKLSGKVSHNKMHWMTAVLFTAAGIYMLISDEPATGGFFLVAGLLWPLIVKLAAPDRRPDQK